MYSPYYQDLRESFREMTDEGLKEAYENCNNIEAKLEIRHEMARRGLAAPKLQKYWKEQSEDALREAYKNINIYADDLEALASRVAIVGEMKSRGLVSDDATLDDYWRGVPDKKLIGAYRQIDQFDGISQEVICAEIRNRRLEAKAATKVEKRARNVELVELGNIPFSSMLSFAWKWIWAVEIALIPVIILWIIIIAIIRNVRL